MKKIWELLTGKTEKKRRESLSNTTLLMTITVCTFFGMYLIAMLIWQGGFLNPQQFLIFSTTMHICL